MSKDRPISPEEHEKGDESKNSFFECTRQFVERIRAGRTKAEQVLTEPTQAPASKPTNKPATVYRQYIKGEVSKWIEALNFEERYFEAVETQKSFQLLRPGEQAPDLKKVLAVFTPAMLETAQSLHEPRLVLITKDRSFKDLIDAISSHNVTVQGYRDKVINDRIPENWAAYLIETKVDSEFRRQNLYCPGDVTLRHALNTVDSYKRKAKVCGMNSLKFTHLVMRALLEKLPFDGEPSIILDEDPIQESPIPRESFWPGWRPREYIAIASWASCYHQLCYYMRDSGASNTIFTDFLLSIGGDIPNP